MKGTIATSAGPVPDTPFAFVTVWVFSGDRPEQGKIVQAKDEITGFPSNSSDASAPTVSAPAPAPETAPATAPATAPETTPATTPATTPETTQSAPASSNPVPNQPAAAGNSSGEFD